MKHIIVLIIGPDWRIATDNLAKMFWVEKYFEVHLKENPIKKPNQLFIIINLISQ